MDHQTERALDIGHARRCLRLARFMRLGGHHADARDWLARAAAWRQQAVAW